MVIAALLACSCGSPALAIRPVIHANEDQAGEAMKTAPMIFVIRIADVDLTGDIRDVAKPAEVAGPRTPTIPLHLARIKADVLITARGAPRSKIEFYSWIWASGSHGGPRLFHAHPGNCTVVFLRDEGVYTHTVGDYPSYDLELRDGWMPAFEAAWKSGRLNGIDVVDRLVALRLKAEFESMTEKRLREGFGEKVPKVNYNWALDIRDLIRVAGPHFVATEIDKTCLHSTNPTARFAACYATAQNFPGRCEAYRVALRAAPNGVGEKLLAEQLQSCLSNEHFVIDDIRFARLQWWHAQGVTPTEAHRRATLRVFASAMDPAVRRAACEVAAGSLPECAGAR